MRRVNQQGFTLVELVVAIVLSGVVAGFVAMFIATPVQAYLAQERRATLGNEAEVSLQMLRSDLRKVVPNSVRHAQSGALLVIEAWPALDVARYRGAGSLGLPLHELDFATADNQFTLFAGFTAISYPFVSSTHRLVINNTGQPGSDVYEQANVITPAGIALRIDDNSSGGVIPGLPGSEDHITLGTAFKFSAPALKQQLYLVANPVRYRCDAANGTLTRYTGYTITSTLTTAVPGGAGVSSSLISNDISACAVSCIPGTAQCSQTVTLNLLWSRDGETLNTLEQIALVHQP